MSHARKPVRSAVIGGTAALAAAAVALTAAVTANQSANAHADAAPANGGGVSVTVAISQAIPTLYQTSAANDSVTRQSGALQPAATYTAVCYLDGDRVATAKGAPSSPHWALIADSTGNLGYVPAVGLKSTSGASFADTITTQLSTCDPMAFKSPSPPVDPKQGQGTRSGTVVDPIPFPFIPDTGTQNNNPKPNCLSQRAWAAAQAAAHPGWALTNQGTGGWILNTTAPVPALNLTQAGSPAGARAAVATACLVNPPGGGQTPGNVSIAGWLDAQATVNGIRNGGNGHPPADPWLSLDVDRCHLIAGGQTSLASLGGPAIPANLVPCWANPTNVGTRGTKGMYDFEKIVSQQVSNLKAGETVYYVVTPVYTNPATSTIPSSFDLSATKQQSPTGPPTYPWSSTTTIRNEKQITSGTQSWTVNLGN